MKTESPSLLSLPVSLPLSSQFGTELKISLKPSANGGGSQAIELTLLTNGKSWAMGELALGSGPADVKLRRSNGGLSLIAKSASSYFAARFIPAKNVAGVQVLERARGAVAKWEWKFPGSTVFTHKQLAIVSTTAKDARFPMGAFTQYGQLRNVKDWTLTQNGDLCAGLISLHVGTWSHPTIAALQATGTSEGLTIDMRWKQPKPKGTRAAAVARTYLLVQATAKEALTPTRLGIDYFEPADGFCSWPASIISRYGTSRPERIAAMKRTIDLIDWKRPTRFLYGDEKLLKFGFDRAKKDASFAEAMPFWGERFDEAKKFLFDEMERLQQSVAGWAYLHPWGNAVGIRPFAPLCILYHFLDFMGKLTDQERKRAAFLITDVTELFLRADFYPHDYSTFPPEYPYGPDSFYRGMLNQNFNTDCFVIVGLAGCVLPQHPRAKIWRDHAAQQFDWQMRAYVWPGGAWEESHTYANHVKLTLLPFLWAMRFMPEPVDLIADERFRETCRFFPRILSTKDAVLGGTRGIPAVGDHGYVHGNAYNVFGWLATLCNKPGDQRDANDRQLFAWTWETSGKARGEGSLFAKLLNPLLLPDSETSTPTPELPRLQNLEGYGASFRGGTIGGDDETLLVVRCGLSWGHYQADQGSFWWWAHGRLLCCDADLGSGELKFAHRGSSVLAYPGLEPLQHLDRPNYHVDHCEAMPGGGATIRCQLPVVAWGPSQKEIPIAADQRPHDVRYYNYGGKDHLTIIDEPTKSPGDVMWCLHVPAKDGKAVSATRIVFDFDGTEGKLQIDLPTVPKSVEIKRFGATVGLFCTYSQQRLVHEVRFVSAK